MKDLFKSLEFLQKILYLKNNEHTNFNLDNENERKIVADAFEIKEF